MWNIQSFLDTKAGLKLMGKGLRLSQGSNSVRRRMPHLSMAKQEPLQSKRRVLCHVIFGNLCKKICSSIVLNLAANMPHNTTISDRFNAVYFCLRKSCNVTLLSCEYLCSRTTSGIRQTRCFYSFISRQTV